jgi:hypothetical protein
MGRRAVTAGVVLTGDWPRARVACLVPMPDRCQRRADACRDYAARVGLTAYPTAVASIVSRRMVWDAPAAGEYVRPILADACDAAELRPDLSGAIWHAAAGALITAPGCDCDTPAGFRDTFAAIGRTIAAHAEVTR